jgi:hypothetical protein
MPGPDEWPRVYVPREGMAPRRSPLAAGPPLRVLLLGLWDLAEPQAAMRDALRTIGPYAEVSWRSELQHGGAEAGCRRILEAVKQHKPDLILSQIQGPSWPQSLQAAVAAAKGPACLWADWTGDVRTDVDQPVSKWMTDLANYADLMLADTITYPVKLRREENVPAMTGYLSCAVDLELNRYAPEVDEGAAVFTGMNYGWMDAGYRTHLFEQVAVEAPGTLELYGESWQASPILAAIGRPPMRNQEAVAPLFRKRRVTV